jgi:diadenosine tetraphosphate (Ap4A) HIT family hydrolase
MSVILKLNILKEIEKTKKPNPMNVKVKRKDEQGQGSHLHYHSLPTTTGTGGHAAASWPGPGSRKGAIKANEELHLLIIFYMSHVYCLCGFSLL